MRRGELQAKLETAFGALARDDAPGFAVLLKQNGDVLFREGFGVRDLRTKAKIDLQTNFRLASCTKQFTAMAIMLLVGDGRLRYDETLTAIFPGFPSYGSAITVRTLLNHTSGLADYEDLMDEVEKRTGRKTWSAERQITDHEVFRLLEGATQGKFAPGSQWEYSNSGYVVLGLIVQKRSGQSFGDFLQKRIFAPLEMKHTLVFEKGRNRVANRAYGHSRLPARPDRGFGETDQSSTSATEGDGGVYSNLEDLSRWDDALKNHKLLGEEEFRQAITPAALPPGAGQKLAADAPESLRSRAVSYGFGWFLDLKPPDPLMWHYGETVGFKTAILRHLGSNVTVIVLANRQDLDAGAIALEAARALATGPRPSP